MPETETLKPCPFCGSGDVELRESVTDAMVACCECGARTGLIYLGASDAGNAANKRELIAAWNTRATAPDELATLRAENERLNSLCAELEVSATDLVTACERIVKLDAQLAAMQAQADRLAEALRWYADLTIYRPSGWQGDMTPPKVCAGPAIAALEATGRAATGV